MLCLVRSLLRSLEFILRHPLNRGRRARALARWLRWQVGGRLALGPVAVDFVSGSRLLVTPGMTGATGNVYTGLHELESMAFVAQALRPGDTFVDVGANVGSYTVLASAVAGATTWAFEPVPSTYAHLVDNVRLNAIEAWVHALNRGVADTPGWLKFTTGQDTTNHVADDQDPSAVPVEVVSLDEALAHEAPTILKIDVEGFEVPVLRGANRTLGAPSLMAVVVELIGNGSAHGYSEREAHDRLLRAGFRTARYDPFNRQLTPTGDAIATEGNTLYVRGPALTERLRNAPPLRWLGLAL